MGMAVGRRAGPIAEINVTPFADVIVVLLIIFMIAVPMLSDDRALALPRALNSPERNGERLVITIAGEGAVRIGSREVSEPELIGRIQGALLDRPQGDRIVYVRADERLPYSRVERVLDLSRQAGAEHVALVTAPRRR
jgi:biopolymer transport protein TolR